MKPIPMKAADIPAMRDASIPEDSVATTCSSSTLPNTTLPELAVKGVSMGVIVCVGVMLLTGLGVIDTD